MSGSARSISAARRRPVPAVTLVVGPEAFLASRAVGGVIERARALDPEVEVVDVTAADLAPGALTAHASPSLFASLQLLVVRDLHDVVDGCADELRAVLDQAPDELRVVLLHDGCSKGKALLTELRGRGVEEIRCDPLTRAEDQVNFVAQEVAAAGGRIDDDAARLVVEAVGPDLPSLAAAAAQLCADGQGLVTTELVGVYFAGHGEVKGFVVADRAVEGRAAEALEQLRWALETGTAPLLVTSALASSLRSLGRLGSAPRAVRDADLARELGIPGWKVGRLRNQLRGWTPEGLRTAIQVVADTDARVKGAGNDAGLALARAVVAIAAARER